MNISIMNIRLYHVDFIKTSAFKILCQVVSVCFLALVPTNGRCQETGLKVDSLRVGEEAPAFAMGKIGTNELVYLSDFSGELRFVARIRKSKKKVVILSFFTSWCENCPKEMGALTEVGKEYEERDVQVLFINLDEPDSIVASWLAENPQIQGTVLMDRDGIWAIRYGVSKLPRTIIIDKERIVQFVEYGFNSETYRKRIVEALENILGSNGA